MSCTLTFPWKKINNLIFIIHTVEIWQGQRSYLRYIYQDNARLTHNCAHLSFDNDIWPWLPSGYIQLTPKASFSSLASSSTPLQQPGTDLLCLNNSPSTLSASMGKSHIMNTFLWRILELCVKRMDLREIICILCTLHFYIVSRYHCSSVFLHQYTKFVSICKGVEIEYISLFEPRTSSWTSSKLFP